MAEVYGRGGTKVLDRAIGREKKQRGRGKDMRALKYKDEEFMLDTGGH